MTQTDQDFFQPKWRRITATIICFAWAALEWWSGQAFWGVLALGVSAYCVWNFFYKFEQKQSPRDAE